MTVTNTLAYYEKHIFMVAVISYSLPKCFYADLQRKKRSSLFQKIVYEGKKIIVSKPLYQIKLLFVPTFPFFRQTFNDFRANKAAAEVRSVTPVTSH
jgi:hypothetical protein